MLYIIFVVLALIFCANTTNASPSNAPNEAGSSAVAGSPTAPSDSATSMAVEIYTIPSCPGCEMAKSTLESRKIGYTEISLYGRRDLYRQMKERVNAALPASERRPLDESMTVPKIFINGKYVPYSDLDDYLDKLAAGSKGNSNPNSASTKNKNEDS